MLTCICRQVIVYDKRYIQTCFCLFVSLKKKKELFAVYNDKLKTLYNIIVWNTTQKIIYFKYFKYLKI